MVSLDFSCEGVSPRKRRVAKLRDHIRMLRAIPATVDTTISGTIQNQRFPGPRLFHPLKSILTKEIGSLT
jgi:hypothetical protein